MADAIKRSVKSRTPTAPDREVHVSTIRVAGHDFVEIREYIPSLKQYGRGVVFSNGENYDALDGVFGGLEKCYR